MEVGGQRHVPAALPLEKEPVRIIQEAGWVPGPVATGAENLTSTGIRFPDHPNRSESPYRLHYPGPQNWRHAKAHYENKERKRRYR
jgi:hypothetical protein